MLRLQRKQGEGIVLTDSEGQPLALIKYGHGRRGRHIGFIIEALDSIQVRRTEHFIENITGLSKEDIKSMSELEMKHCENLIVDSIKASKKK